MIEQDQQVIEEEFHEALFEELMSSNLDTPLLVDELYDPCVDRAPTDLSTVSSSELLKETQCSPLVTPSTIHKWSANSSSYDPDGPPTPKSSPLVQRCAGKTEMLVLHRPHYTDEGVVPFSSSVVRRHISEPMDLILV